MGPPQRTILIVEDDELIRHVLIDKFSTAGFAVSYASDGEEGLYEALSNHPDVILLDIILPKMNGLAMLAKLREDSWGKSAIVFVASSLHDSVDMSKAHAHNIVGYFIKEDWNPDDLVRDVEEKITETTPIAR